MDAKELRIGNWVKYIGGEAIVENGEAIMDIDDGLDRVEPIPLTEEWLVRFGLQCYQFDNGQPNQYRFKDRIIVIRHGKFYDYGSGVLLEYVHKFQNLCFALTGEEPTIK